VPEYLRISTLRAEDRRVVLPPSSIGPGGRVRGPRGVCAIKGSATPVNKERASRLRTALRTLGPPNASLVTGPQIDCIEYPTTWLSQGFWTLIHSESLKTIGSDCIRKRTRDRCWLVQRPAPWPTRNRQNEEPG